MKLLLHVCCGPCAIYPLSTLREQGMTVMGYFYNPNIHPYTEWAKRRETLAAFAEAQSFKVIDENIYDVETFLRQVVFREKKRCGVCYHERLTATARMAKKSGFDGFSTTLLYSKFQNHGLIRDIAEAAAAAAGVAFFYQDFREGWKAGIAASKAAGMYRQQYCGCIYSESERYRSIKPYEGPGADAP